MAAVRMGYVGVSREVREEEGELVEGGSLHGSSRPGKGGELPLYPSVPELLTPSTSYPFHSRRLDLLSPWQSGGESPINRIHSFSCPIRLILWLVLVRAPVFFITS